MGFPTATRWLSPLPSVPALLSSLLAMASLQTNTQAAALEAKRQSSNYTIDPKEYPLDPRGGSYPRMTRLADGSLMVASGRLANGNTTVLQVSKSTPDDPLTFAAWGEVTRGPMATKDLANTFVIEVPGSGSGSSSNPTPPILLAAYRNHDVITRTPAYKASYYRITLSKSLDGGKSWQLATQIAEHPANNTAGYKNGLWEPFIRVDDAGSLQLTFSEELQSDNQETFRSVSSDGAGAEWSAAQNLQVHSPSVHVRDGMQGIVKVVDGVTGRDTWVMVFETNPAAAPTDGRFRVEYALSYDDGASYVRPADNIVYQAPEGRNAGAPQIESFAVDGSLVVSFMTDEDVTGTQDWPQVAKVKTVFAPLGVRDGKIVFGGEQLVGPQSSHWAGLWALSDTEVMCVYENGPKLVGKIITHA